jgi:thioester reductase-like protein
MISSIDETTTATVALPLLLIAFYVAIYWRYTRPQRLAAIRRWHVHKCRTRRADGCQSCGKRVYPSETLYCCGVCETDFRWCETCYARDSHQHRMLREFVQLEIDPEALSSANSVPHAMLTAFELYAPRWCLGRRRAAAHHFEWLTYEQTRLKATAFAARLLQTHCVGDTVWLIAAPSSGPSWFVAQYGALLAGLLVLPLHATTTADALREIAKRAPPRCVVADFASVRDRLPSFDDDVDLIDIAHTPDFATFDVAQHVRQFAGQAARFVMLLPSSGSTGTPKLTIVTDAMLRQQVVVPRMGADNVLLAHQPLNQSLDMLSKGGRIGCGTSLDEMERDLQALRPTVFGATPVVFQGWKARFDHMIAEERSAEAALRRFRALKLLGNRCKIAIVGGAKCSPALRDFIWQAFECVVTDGYGASEVGALAANGAVSAAVELRLIDAPDIGFLTSDTPPRGEILARSARLTPGYYGDDAETARNFVVVDGQRFYRTGDVGVLESGKVVVIDRRGALFKLAQGVFVAASRLESLFEAESVITGCFVYGNSDMFNVAAVVKLAPGCTRTDAMRAITSAAERHALKAYERPTVLIVDGSDWSDLFTGNGKKQRARFAERFGARLTAPPAVSSVSDADTQRLNSGLVALINSHIVSVHGRAASLAPELTLSEIGADSLALARLSSAIREQLHKEIHMAQLARLTLRSLQLVLFSGHSLADALAESSAVDWQAEAERAVAEVPPVPVSSVSRDASLPSCVFLTGCTGFVGAFLLRRLLDADARTVVFCLVRAGRVSSSQRIVRVMNEFGLTLSEADAVQRVVPLVGDLAMPRFGLGDAEWCTLADRMAKASSSVVLHNGATVSSAASFGALRAANVLGALWACRLAQATRSFLCHHSSVGFLSGQREEARVVDTSKLALSLLSGYAQSKCVAELALQVCAAAADAPPMLIVRSGTVSGATSSGVCNVSDSVMKLLHGIARERAVVAGDADSPFPASFLMLPVDVTARLINELCAQRATGVVHLLCRKQIPFASLVTAVRSHGITVGEIDADSFRRRVDAIVDRAHPWYTLKSVLSSRHASHVFAAADVDAAPFNRRVHELLPLCADVVDKAATVDDLRAMLRFLVRAANE